LGGGIVFREQNEVDSYETNAKFMTTYQLATGDATLTIALPEELRGEPLKIVVAKELATPQRSTMRKFIDKYSGILKDCGIENTESRSRCL